MGRRCADVPLTREETGQDLHSGASRRTRRHNLRSAVPTALRCEL